MAKGKDAVLDLTPQQERAMVGEAFPGLVPDVHGGRIDLSRPREASGQVSEEHSRYMNRLNSELRRQAQVGVKFASVINMNPYPLRINGTLYSSMVVPAATSVKEPAVHVIDTIAISRMQQIEGDDYPILWHPILQAREFDGQYYESGGVVVYEGDLSRVDLEAFKAANPAFARNYEEAHQRRIGWARERVAKANDEWNTPNRIGARNITKVDRQCAQLLHEVTGQQMPPWIDVIPGQYGKGEVCRNCRSIPAGDAISCEKCGYVLDPAKAYEEGLIDVENDALRRLSRGELEKLGISELIDETHEERKERNRSDATAKRIANQGAKK